MTKKKIVNHYHFNIRIKNFKPVWELAFRNLYKRVIGDTGMQDDKSSIENINTEQKKDSAFFDKHKIKWTVLSILGILLTAVAVGIEHWLKIKF